MRITQKAPCRQAGISREGRRFLIRVPADRESRQVGCPLAKVEMSRPLSAQRVRVLDESLDPCPAVRECALESGIERISSSDCSACDLIAQAHRFVTVPPRRRVRIEEHRSDKVQRQSGTAVLQRKHLILDTGVPALSLHELPPHERIDVGHDLRGHLLALQRDLFRNSLRLPRDGARLVTGLRR
jgi:hypothetical protein